MSDGPPDLDASRRPRAVLIGAMGAGKTTVAHLLGEQWGLPVRDTDEDIETAAGCSISDLFVDHGEEHFRVLERNAVAVALTEHRGVLSLGGGAVLDAQTQQWLDGHTVVFLQVGLSDAVKRVGLGVARPLLLGNVRARVKALLDERTPVYTRLATVVVDTDGKDPAEVADEVRAALETASGRSGPPDASRESKEEENHG